jgi:plasmid stabilization system protein ParE
VRRIQILAAARRDLVDGYRFYERQAEGTGRYFLDTLYSDIESLRLYAGIHPLCIGDYRRLLSKRFPWSIYYRLQGQEIRVYAVLDNRRNPNWIKQRLPPR